MTTGTRGGGGRDQHLDRIYTRIDDLAARVGRLERSMWIGAGSLGTVAMLNLISNISQMSGQ